VLARCWLPTTSAPAPLAVDPDTDPADVRGRNDPASLPAILTIAQDNKVTVAT
jgi:hypothetical protein